MQSNIPETVFDRISRIGIVPVVIIEDARQALPLADALLAGGLPIIEVTFRTAAAAEVIQTLRQERPQLVVGAGTLLTRANVEVAKDCGAAFGVSPGLNPEVVNRAQELDLPFIPGVATPSEIEIGLSLGCNVLKFFPAEALGGPAMIDAVWGPFKHVGLRFMPSGGVTTASLEKYLRVPCVAAAGGTWIARPEDLASGNWKSIQEKARDAVKLVAQAKRG